MNSLEFYLQDRLVSIIDSILSNKEFQLSWIRKRKYLEDQASIIRELEIEMPEVWVPLRLACSGLLTR
jgi:hypothetical protein